MRITKEIKPSLNLLISYYRGELAKQDENYLPKNFIYDEDNNLICTLSTLSRLENNKTQCFDSIYYALLENLNMSYSSETRVNELIEDINRTILKHAEINDRAKLTKLLETTLNILGPYRDYIIYREQIEIYVILLNYYRDFEFDEALLDKHLQLITIVNDKLKPIFIDVVLIYYTRLSIDRDKSLRALRHIELCKTKSIITDYIFLVLYFRIYDLDKVKKIGEELIIHCKNANSNFYLSKTYNLLSSLYTRQDPSISIEYLQNSISNFNINFDFQNNLDIYLSNLANISCMNGNYKIAIENYRRIEFSAPEKLALIFPYYLYALDKFNSPENEKIMVLQNLEIFSKEIEYYGFFPIYNLFEIQYGLLDYSKLDNVITELIQMKKNLQQAPPILLICEHVLHNLCNAINDFKSYNKFMKTFHK